MSQFQSQGQWENDLDNQVPVEQYDNNNVRKSYKKIYVIIAVLFAIAITCVFMVYHYARPIEGIWIRQADDNYGAEGMTVEVVRHGALYEGKVINGSDDKTKFKEGQIKWFQLKKVGFGLYECYDLCQEIESGTFYYDDMISTLTVHSGGKTLTLEAPNHSAGAHQLWVKSES